MKTKSLLGALAIIGLLVTGAQAQVTVSTLLTNGLAEPYDIAVDLDINLYVSDGGNNRIVKIDANSQLASTLAGIPTAAPGSEDGPAYQARFNNPQGLLVTSLAGNSGLVVADAGNNLIRFVRLHDSYVTTLAGQVDGGPAVNATGTQATFRYPAGLAQDEDGNVYIADWGNNTIRVLNLNDPLLGVTNLVVANTSFNRPAAVTYAGKDSTGAKQLWVADTGNQQVKLITLTGSTVGTLTTHLGGYRSTGSDDAMFGPSARFNAPRGLLWVDGLGLLISDTMNHSIRLATSNPNYGPTNYSVTTFAGSPEEAGLENGTASMTKFNSPSGLARDDINNAIMVADLANNAIRRIQKGPPLPPIATPEIGKVDYIFNPDLGLWVSVLRPVTSQVFNNPITIAIKGDESATYFTAGASSLSDNVPDPTINDKQAPPYEDGWTREEVNKYPQVSTILQLPKSGYERVTIKARGIRRGQTPSPVITSEFTFQTATPNLLGNNAFHFTLTDVTSNCVVYYTTDGSKPTTNSAYFELTGGQYVGSFPSNNFPFVFFAHREGFVDSGLVSNYFSAADFVPNRITFGFDSGEASSLFLASPGQRYYAPVTLSILPGTRMYSLQFNLVVTNSGAAPTVTPRAFGFESTLVKPDTLNPGKFVGIPTAMFLDLISEPKPNPPPGERVFEYGKGWFQDLQFIDSRLNLLGVGWIERYLYDNLYNTKEQDLIKYSLPHDNLFEEDNGKVVLGGYWFQVPTNATPNQQYQIRIGLPSATADGVSVPVFIDTPTNGAIQAAKTVTLGQHKYLVGDVAPFRWFNAGEFGDSKLENNDAVQVFQSAIYGVNKPLPGSDMLDSMDSCGRTFIDRGHGYLEPSQYASNLDALFYGDDTTINQIAFGDGILDVCDVYVTFRRSLDPSLSYFRRFWTNGVRAAEFDATRPIPAGQQSLPLATRPTVTYMCGDVVANAGQTVQVPVTAKISGDFPLRVLMLKLSVQPLDGSPVLTVPVQFTPSPALGQPTQVSASGTSDYAAAWLNNQIIGLTGTATVGTLTIQIPTNAPANAAYAVHFDHASASPNGLASFGKQTVTGLITLSDRSSSSCNDSIPDSWRLRHFATLNNQLSLANADADGDGANNWQEFVAGTDPVNLESCLRLATEMKTMPQGRESVIRWPSIAGKQYVIEQSSDLFAPTWTPMSTNTGTGADMELRLPEGGTIRFYRVRVAH